LPGWSRSAIDKEWREQVDSTNDDETLTLTAVAYWKSALSARDHRGNKRFLNLAKFVQYLFSLPFSTVASERLFSLLKEVKTDRRNRLATVTLASTIQTKLGMKRAGVTADTLTVDMPLRKRLKGVVASASTAE
jgi:hypothetical protein